MHPIIEVLQRTPIRPDAKLVRSVMASVFNNDLLDDKPIPPQHAVVVMAFKLLLDMAYEQGHLIHTFRFFRKDIDKWRLHDVGVINMSDNRYSMFFTYDRAGHEDTKVYDYRECEVLATAPEPVFQTSVNLRVLAVQLATALESPEHSPTEEAATATES